MKLNRFLGRSFALYRQKHNPDKHLFIRDLDNTAISYAWFGRVFEIKKQAESDLSEKLEKQIIEQTFSYLKSATQGKFNFAAGDYEKVKLNSWWVYDIDLTKHLDDLIETLGNKVVSHETRLRANVDKEIRNEIARKYFCPQEYKNQPIDAFVNAYGKMIEIIDYHHNHGMSTEINKIPIESVKCLLQEEKPQPASNIDISEKSSLINRFVKWMHS